MQRTPELEGLPSVVHERLLLALRRKLKRRDRLFLVLHFLQKLNHEEVACVMECSTEEVEASLTQSMSLVRTGVSTEETPKMAPPS
jgi:DNA-directed RNA polymerase specialized sigma24 family protein